MFQDSLGSVRWKNNYEAVHWLVSKFLLFPKEESMNLDKLMILSAGIVAALLVSMDQSKLQTWIWRA
jgi:hypothetical protein